MQKTNGRKPISKSLRYDIFTRDGYTCQYCGGRPPDSTLQIDHRVPVVSGGDNDPMNLVTACVECNAGKKAKLPGAYAPIPDALIEAAQAEHEASEYREYLAQATARKESEQEVVDFLADLWAQGHNYDPDGYTPSESVIRGWLKRFRPQVIEEAIRITNQAASRTPNLRSTTTRGTDHAINYASAVMYNLVKENVG